MKSFHEMTADEIAEHREKWRKGEAEIWTCTTARRSVVDPKRMVDSDHEAPTRVLCALAASQACADGRSWMVTNPMKVLPVFVVDDDPAVLSGVTSISAKVRQCGVAPAPIDVGTQDERDDFIEEEHRRLDEVEAEYLRDRRRGPGDA